MRAEERGRIAEDVAHAHAFADRGERHLARGEGRDQAEVSFHPAVDLVADVIRMFPEAGVFAVELVERQLRRQDRVGDVEQFPVARVDRVLGCVPEIRAGERREDGEAGVVGAGGVDPLLEFFKVRPFP